MPLAARSATQAWERQRRCVRSSRASAWRPRPWVGASSVPPGQPLTAPMRPRARGALSGAAPSRGSSHGLDSPSKPRPGAPSRVSSASASVLFLFESCPLYSTYQRTGQPVIPILPPWAFFLPKTLRRESPTRDIYFIIVSNGARLLAHRSIAGTRNRQDLVLPAGRIRS
ncbi:hypothetical protein M432DRAFT_306843 [Thermoascus aurantiacus ATCC 26904]